MGFVDAEDISAVGFHALTDKAPHNREHIITGPQSLSYAEVAALIHRLAGLTVKHLSIPEDQLVLALTAAGVPAPMLLSWWGWITVSVWKHRKTKLQTLYCV